MRFRPNADLRRIQPERVCLIKPSALGDIVNALPVLSALKAHWPKARFSWVVNRGLSGLIEGHPDLDEVIVFERTRGGNVPGRALSFARFLRGLRARGFDLTIDLQGLLRSGIMTAATGAKYRVGRGDSREGASCFYSHRVEPPDAVAHAVTRLLGVAEVFGADVSEPHFVLPIAAADRAWACDVLGTTPRPRMVLNLGARWLTKRWPAEHFAAVASRAIEEFGAGLVTVGGPEDREAVDRFRNRLPAGVAVLDLCGGTTLPRLAAVAAESDLVLSNDSGPLHLATAAGARVVGVYTCTSPRLNGPFGPKAMAVSTEVWCAASYVTCCSRLICFAELTPERVWKAVREQLIRAASAGRSVA